MWRFLWRSIDRFSLQYFRYIINEFREIKVVDKLNRELVVDLMQSIVEIVMYGDRHDPSIFECFMEYQVLAEFVRVLKISRNSRIEAPLLQYLSIMMQNIDSEHAIYYCLSNDYINSIITHQYEFDGEDLASYYVSFLRAVSSKLNRDTLCLLVNVHEDVVVSFPLYTEALKFAYHEEKMIQIAVRALTLDIYNVSDDMVFQFVTTPPASEYFSDLVLSLRKKCFHLDALFQATEESFNHERRKELLLGSDKIIDDLYYFNDILHAGKSRLGKMVTQNLVSLLVFPILLPLLQLIQSSGTYLSAIISLYVVSRFLQLVEEKKMVNFVASAILCPDMFTSMRDAAESVTSDGITLANSFVNHFHEMKETVCPEPEGAENFERDYLLGHLSEYMPCNTESVGFPPEYIHKESSGLLSYILSENASQMLVSLMLLIILAENKDLDNQLKAMIGFSETKTRMQKTQDSSTSASPVMDRSFLVIHMPRILNTLLKVLASQQPFSVLIKWHTGWFLRKLLVLGKQKLSSHVLYLFNISYQESRECVWKELDGCWFDYIPDTLRNEWESCKTALEESSQSKDPFFALELACQKHTPNGSTDSNTAWQRMVDVIKVLVLHLQLKAFIFNEDLSENPLRNLKSSSSAIFGGKNASDLSSASFGSEVGLGSGIPCKIAFSKDGIRDIYMIPVAREVSGKMLLAEKHPLRSKRGVVIAIAPLAGLNPNIDENHPTWLYLRIREFDPKICKTGGHRSSNSYNEADGKWTLGFPNAESCEAARLLILEETRKQRSAVESLIAPLLEDISPADLSDSQGD